MPEWTGEVVGMMHVHGIKATELAARIGWNDKYLSAILNGRRTPRDAEMQVKRALYALVEERSHGTGV